MRLLFTLCGCVFLFGIPGYVQAVAGAGINANSVNGTGTVDTFFTVGEQINFQNSYWNVGVEAEVWKFGDYCNAAGVTYNNDEDPCVDPEFDTSCDSTGNNVYHTYNSPGTYEVRLVVIDDNLCYTWVGDTKIIRIEPAVTDTDGDGLDDDEEISLGTDPNNPDTDGDNMNDGAEVASGRNPLLNEVALMVVVNSLLLN